LQIQQNPSLTRRDLELLDKDLLLRMMRNRVILVFSSVAPWNKLNLEEIQGMYYLDNIDGTYNWSTSGNTENTYQLWFELPTDKDIFLQKLAELKLST
tara:strand:- start:348 stop:641 length:294 start_codon:yes stop_codon:yes gene_type:complete